mmetsp:Transcript_18743/g.17872  ORF Transcript_18743/g.17872 Transcript_18743/m.17872 type:complete len:249 (-) Transcript_18743:724-1470(-)
MVDQGSYLKKEEEEKSEKKGEFEDEIKQQLEKTGSQEESKKDEDKVFKKLLNEIEIRFRKEEPEEIKKKRLAKKNMQGKSRKLVALVGKGNLMVAMVSHVLFQDNTGEFDPYYIERIKNCINMMIDKNFIDILEKEMSDKNTFSVKKANQNPKIGEKRPSHQEISSHRDRGLKGEQVQNTPSQQDGNKGLDGGQPRMSGIQFSLKKQEFLSQQRTTTFDNFESPPDKHQKGPMQILDDEFKLATLSIH